MRYDLTLKQLLEGQPSRLLQRLTGVTAFTSLNVEWPNIRRRAPDLVLLLPDNSVQHLEIQSGPHPQMHWRMLEYYLLLRQRFPTSTILQQVLYVGQKPHEFVTEIQDVRIQFSYQVIDLRELDCEVLLASPALGDALLAVLCQMQDAHKTVHEIVRRIAALEEKAREDALIHFLHLAGLRRKISPIIAAELDAMPITVNVRDNPFYQQIFHAGAEQGEQLGLAKGKAEGKAEGEQLGLAKGRERLLRKLLHLKFGPLPQWAEAKLAAADSDTLELWAERVLSEGSLEGVLGSPASPHAD
jgi:predicted transposase YdaD